MTRNTKVFMVPAFKYLTGESDNICRLCCCVTEKVIHLDESRTLESHYCDETVTFEDIFSYLQAPNEPSLPEVLCKECADLTIKAFLFKKLCQYSYEKWHESIGSLEKSLEYTDSLSPMVKTTYFLVHKEKDLILTSTQIHTQKTKELVLKKIQDLLIEKKKRRESKRKQACPFCPKVFTNLANLLQHKERMHRPKNVKCAKCAKRFSSNKMLKYHNSSFHTPCICKLCSMEFPSKIELRAHLNRHGVNQCDRCSKEFSSKLVLKMHLKICGEDKKAINAICDICNKGYVRKNSLRSHLIMEHGFGSNYKCNWCSKQFDAVSKLKLHVVKHTRERNFSCELCGGQFVTKAALTYHTRIHTGEKPFPCDLCGESFLSASRRMEHKRRKHLGPMHQCNVCDSKFITKFSLNQHQVRHKNPQSRLFVGENDVQKNSVRNIVYQTIE